MNKHNLVLRTAVALALSAMATSSFAGNMSTTTRTFATENFGATQAATVAITPAAISYAISSPGGVTLSPGQTMTSYLRLSGTHTFAAGTLNVDFTSLAAVLGAGGVPVITWAAGATANTMAVTYTNTSGASVNLPVNTTIIWTPWASVVSASSSALATAGGTVSISGSLDGGVANNAAVTLPSNQDPVATPVNIATTAAAVTGVVTSSAAFTVVETKKIDLAAATGTATAFNVLTAPFTNTSASTTIVNLGSYKFTNNAAVTPTDLAGGPYALGAAAAATGAVFTGTSVVVTPGAGQTFPVGSFLQLTSDLTCAAPIMGIGTALTATTAAAAVTLASTGGNAVPGTALPYYVCLTVPGTVAGVITPVNTTVGATLTKAVATDASNVIAATPVYPLGYNGSQIDVVNYVPAAVTGWTQYLRIANTGVLTTNVSAAVIDETTGVVGTAGVVITNLAAGATTNLTASQIEAVVGAQPAAARPRIRITASTNGLTVQNMLFTPNGSFTNNSSAQNKGSN